MRAVLAGTGMYVPENVIDNDRLSRVMNTSDEWIQKRTGIRQRRFANLGQSSSDLAVPAARQAIEEAGLQPSDIDYIVFATMTPDHYFPGSGPLFQRQLGVHGVPTIDIRQQCSGFLYGMQMADAFIRSGQYRNVLVVGAEVHGGFMPWSSWDVVMGQSDREIDRDEYEWNSIYRNRTVLFGDGAGAFVFKASDASEGGGLEDVIVHSDGRYAEKMYVPAGGSRYRPYFTREQIDKGAVVPIVEGPEVFKMAVVKLPEVVESILEKNGHTLDDVRLLILHQANLRINEAVQKRLGVAEERVFNNIQRYGNTTAATLPLAFHEARAQHDLQPGDLICFAALGSGLTWGAALYRW